MKSSISFLLILVATGISHAQIGGSAHDFSATSWAQRQICLPCHAPHNNSFNGNSMPLWNRADNTRVYTVYTSGSLDALVGQPSGVSKLCLSCHDGITALDAFNGSTGNIFIHGKARLGTDIRDHHPVSFTYDTALAARDNELNDPLTAPSGLGRTITQDLLLNQRVECVTCHDAHNHLNNLLLVDTGTGPNGLCSTCHRNDLRGLLDRAGLNRIR